MKPEHDALAAAPRAAPAARFARWRRLSWVLGTALVLAACSRSESPAGQIPASTPAPAADNASAESALRTYWQMLDWYGGRFVVGRVKPEPEGKAALRAALGPLVVESVDRSFDERPPSGRRFKGTITAVEPVSGAQPETVDLHAELVSLDHSDASLTPTPVELFVGESIGGAFRYRLIRQPDGWRIAEVWRVDPKAPAQRIR